MNKTHIHLYLIEQYPLHNNQVKEMSKKLLSKLEKYAQKTGTSWIESAIKDQ